MKKQIHFAVITAVLLIGACKKNSNDDDNNPGGGGNNDPVAITSTSPEYVVWGSEVTINGTGFSATKEDNYVWITSDADCGTNTQDSTDWKKATVVSATATKLVIKLPYTTLPSDNSLPCGPYEGAQLHVTVKGKERVTTPQYIKTVGLPFPTFFSDNYPGYHGPTAMRRGDSVFLGYGGQSIINLVNSGYKDNIRLKVNGSIVSTTKYLKGIAFKLPIEQFAGIQCDDTSAVWGIQGVEKSFKVYFEGMEDYAFAKNYFIGHFPKPVIADVSGPIVVSKSAGGNPFIKVTGNNMNFPTARIIALNGCSGGQTFSINGNGYINGYFHVYIPLSIMNAGCSYAFRLIDMCGAERHIWNVSIVQ